ncbi:MAG: hypothetical protein IJN43_13715 [Ruminococcus sp.]|nr:hypothetical protein [Ruminococcus sp.]
MATKKEEAQVTPEMNEDILKALDEKIAKMLLAAEEKANEIIEAAEKRAAEMNGAKVDADTAKANAELEEYVEIQLFKDNDKYKDDVYVAVNGENCLIKRGIKTKIKKKFALVLEQSSMQDLMTGQYMDTKAAEYEASAREHNM